MAAHILEARLRQPPHHTGGRSTTRAAAGIADVVEQAAARLEHAAQFAVERAGIQSAGERQRGRIVQDGGKRAGGQARDHFRHIADDERYGAARKQLPRPRVATRQFDGCRIELHGQHFPPRARQLDGRVAQAGRRVQHPPPPAAKRPHFGAGVRKRAGGANAVHVESGNQGGGRIVRGQQRTRPTRCCG